MGLVYNPIHNKQKGYMIKKNNDPFGFNKAINWDKLEDPKVLKELKKLFDEQEENKRKDNKWKQ